MAENNPTTATDAAPNPRPPGTAAAAAAATRPPTTTVHRHNIWVVLPVLQQLAAVADVVALDLEFTGLGSAGARGRSTDLQEQYQGLCSLVQSHAVAAIGLCLAVRAPRTDDGAPPAYRLHTFSIPVFQSTEFVVSPASLVFLVEHGFDFNYMVTAGVPFRPAGLAAATDTSSKAVPALLTDTGDQSDALQALHAALRKAKGPLVVHNGLLDLLFLYHALVGPLPSTLERFLADVAALYPSGVVDTKYIAEYHRHEHRSFLSYLFRKSSSNGAIGRHSERSLARAGRAGVPRLVLEPAPALALPFQRDVRARDQARLTHAKEARRVCGTGPYCEFFANHGFCRLGRLCTRSHDLDLILDHVEGGGSGRKRPRTAEPAQGHTDGANEVPPADVGTELTLTDRDVFHAAAYDAYMTGFVFLAQRHELADPAELAQLTNRLYIAGKDFPLRIQTSPFVRPSPSLPLL